MKRNSSTSTSNGPFELPAEPVPDDHHNDDDAPPAYSPMAAADEIISNTTTIRNDGRISINLDSKLSRTLSKLAHSAPPPPSRPATPPPIYTERAQAFSACPVRLNIVIQVVGSRGDVQPFLALGTALHRHGHRVRLATHPTFRTFVRGAGLEFYSIGGDPHELMAYMVRNPGLLPRMASVRAGEVGRKRAMIGEMVEGCWGSCVEADEETGAPFVADAIVANPPSFAHVHCAQALGVPVHLMFTMPWSATRAFAHPLADLRGRGVEEGVANLVSYGVVEWMTWQGLGDVINAWRKKMDLEPVPMSEGPGLVETLKVPFTYCWSPALVPKPTDWPSHIDVCGFFFRDPPNYDPPKDLAAFLDAGDPPVYIGFGSIVIDEPERLTTTILSAVRATGVRAIVSRGWSNLGEAQSTEQVFYLDDCPHEWLFQHVSAVVHHGGAGTTACGLRYGKPTAIVPFFGDQPFWGDMIAAAGAGPVPIPQQRLNSDNLADAIRYCLTAQASKAAREIAEKMKVESGVEAAVASFHKNLPLEKMTCDLLPDQPATWTYTKNKKTIRLSKLAAEIVSSRLAINKKHFKYYETNTITIQNRRWDPLTGGSSVMLGTATDLTRATAGILLDPYLEYRKGRAARPALTTSHTLPPPSLHRSDDSASTTDHKSHSTINLEPHNSTNPRPALSKSASFSHLPPRPPSPTPSTISTTSSAKHRQNLHTAGKMAAASAKSVGKFNTSLFRGMMVDLPLAVADGLRNAPGLYGDKPAELAPVTDWKSGAVAAGKNFSTGMADGVTGLWRQPMQGAREGGAGGAVLGVGKGLVGLGCKTGSAVVGLAGYGGMGLVKSARALGGRGTRGGVGGARWGEGLCMREQGRAEGNLDEVVVGGFGRAMGYQ